MRGLPMGRRQFWMGAEGKKGELVDWREWMEWKCGGGEIHKYLEIKY